MKKMMVLCIAGMFFMTACAGQSKTTQGAAGGAAIGAVLGAGIGQILGKDTESTLEGAAIGAGIGGIGGAAVGRLMDQQEQAFKAALAASEAAAANREEALRTEIVRQKEDVLSIILKGDVAFDSGSAKVKPEIRPEIKRISNVIVEYPNTSITVEGHTDSQGSETTNMDLSKQRADAVRALLIDNGVMDSRIHTMPYGETNPIADNNTPEGRQRNRRVEIKVMATGSSS